MTDVAKPVVHLDLLGPDGNVYAAMAKCQFVLKKAGLYPASNKLREEVIACGSYTEALDIMRKYVEIR